MCWADKRGWGKGVGLLYMKETVSGGLEFGISDNRFVHSCQTLAFCLILLI